MKTGKRIILLNLLGIVSILAFGSFWPSPACSSEPSEITILYTNDIHGGYLPSRATWLENEPEIGGFEALSYYIRRERERAASSLLLDAGDLVTGSAFMDIEKEGPFGGALVEMMNRMGYDGMTPGNHELDVSVSNFRALEESAEFPMICANMARGDELLTKEAYHIYRVGELNVGVIGLTYHPMRGMVPGPNLEGFESTEPRSVIGPLIGRIDSLTDVIVLLSHGGLESNRKLAGSFPAVDLIVGGHDHLELNEPESVNSVLIVQAGSGCQFLGRIDLSVESDSVVEYRSELISLFTENIIPDPEISGLVKRYSSKIDEIYGRKIGKLENRWGIENGRESVLGNWLTDTLKRKLYTDLAIINSGAIRKDLGPGAITVRDIYEMLPFDNSIVTFGCSGRQLHSIAQRNIDNIEEGFVYPLQISGLTCHWRETDSGNEIVELLVNGEPVDSSRVYHVASLDYIVIYNAEKYLGFKVRAYIQTKYKLPESIIEAIESKGLSEEISKGRFVKLDR